MPLTDDQALAALDRLLTAFAATDTEAYFACMAPEATFVFHTEPAPLPSRDAYRAVWDGWLAGGWRVTGCTSTDRAVTLLGDVAVVTHRVATSVETPGGAEHLDERETVVLAASGDDVLVVHEHLSPAP